MINREKLVDAALVAMIAVAIVSAIFIGTLMLGDVIAWIRSPS